MDKAHRATEKWITERVITEETDNFGLIYMAYIAGYRHEHEPVAGDWTKNTGKLPKLHPHTRVDIKTNDGYVTPKQLAVGLNWERMGLNYSIDEWRLHDV